MSGKGRKMNLIRSACKSVSVGGLKLAVKKKKRERCESGLRLGEATDKVAGNQSIENRDCRETERKGDALGKWKDSKVTTISISANPVRMTMVRQEGWNEKFEGGRQTGSAWNIRRKEHNFLEI